MRCLVVGAGIIGVTTAFRLAEAGDDVTLVNAAEPGSGTTGTSFAWVNAGAKSPREYFALNLAGMEAHRRLATEFGASGWLVSRGNLEWALDAAQQSRLLARADELESYRHRESLRHRHPQWGDACAVPGRSCGARGTRRA